MKGCRDAVLAARRIACGSLVALALVAGIATQASAATWIGTTHGKITRSNRWVSGTTTWHGDFWFTTGPGGSIHGQAVLGYEPAIDVSGLNNVINYVKGLVSFPIGLLGPFGGAVNAVGLGQIVGVNVSFSESMAVRRGTLSGTFAAGGRLTLNWTGRTKGVPYGISFALVSGSKRIGGGTAPLHNPFLAAGTLAGTGHAASTSESNSNDNGVAQQTGSYWVAHRIR